MFPRSNVTTEDRIRYAGLIRSGDIEQALDEFIAKYVIPFVDEYELRISEFMEFATENESTLPKMIAGVSAATIGLSLLLKDNFKTITTIYAEHEMRNIKSDIVRKQILETALSKFNEQIEGTMSRTSANVINSIREVQRNFITEEVRLIASGKRGREVIDGLNDFKKTLKEKLPDVFDMMKEKTFLKSTPDSKGISRSYRLETYVDQFVRTSILDVDRVANEVTATIEGDLVVEYYKRDNRTVKTKEREICKSILGKKVLGISLLALTDEVASKLGIMTVSTARNTPDFAMGYNCRHGIRRVSEEINNKVKEMVA